MALNFGSFDPGIIMSLFSKLNFAQNLTRHLLIFVGKKQTTDRAMLMGNENIKLSKTDKTFKRKGFFYVNYFEKLLFIIYRKVLFL